MSEYGIKLVGGPALIKALNELPDKLLNKSLRIGLQKGAEAIRDEMIRLAPSDDGDLRAGIGIEKPKRNKRGERRVMIGPGGKQFYAKFLEFGAYQTTHGKKGDRRRVGFKHPRSFILPAFDKHTDNVIELMAEETRLQIDKIQPSKLPGVE